MRARYMVIENTKIRFTHARKIALRLAIMLLVSLALMQSAVNSAMAATAANNTAKAESPNPYVIDGTLEGHWTLFKRYSDKFNSTALDKKKWVAVTSNGWGNNWSQRADDITEKNGNLEVAVKYQPHQTPTGTTKQYTTGFLRSRAPILYGYFEAKLKGPLPQPGTNGAFWLGGESQKWMRDPGDHPDQVVAHAPALVRDPFTWVEIDIVEAARRPNHPDLYRVSHNVHVFKHPDVIKKARDWSVNVGGGYSTWDPSAEYHIYGCLWTPKVIKMYVDGKLVGSIKNKWWHTPHYILFSNHLRAPYSKPGQGTAKGFPSVMKVDYVRVWKSPGEVQAPLLPKAPVTSRSQWVKGLDLQTFNNTK